MISSLIPSTNSFISMRGFTNKIQASVSLTPQQWQRIEQLRGIVSRGAFIRFLIDTALDGKK